MFEQFQEPAKAFPYQAPSAELCDKYKYLFEIREVRKMRFSKRVIDISVSLIALVIFAIPFIGLFFAYCIEQVFVKQNRGPFLYYYFSITQGRKFKK